MNTLGLLLTGAAARGLGIASLGVVLYLLMPRRRPAAASVLLSTLTGMALVSVLAICPWPRWWSLPMGTGRTAATQSVVEAKSREAAGSMGSTKPIPPAARPESSVIGVAWAVFVRVLAINSTTWGSSLAAHGTGDASTRAAAWKWPAWVATAMLAASVLGLMRLVLGIWSLRCLLKRSRPLVEPGLRELVDLASAELSCVRPVAVRVSDELSTPATVGWLRPVLLFPADWTSWSAGELRAVLGHELAHVRNGDYRALIWSQVCLALHAYNPLAHWLASRLRLEQELAADAAAARLSGGQRPYLVTLAQMAMRHDQRHLAVPARAFLPTRDTFVRRIQMLRDMKGLEPQSPSHRSRLVAGLVLGIAAIVLAGVRGPATAAPGQDSVLVLDPGAPAVAPVQAAASTRDDALALVSEMTDMVLVIQPAELLAQPGARESLDKSGLRATFGQQLGMPVEEVELVVVLWFDHPGSPKGEGSPVPQPAAMLLRSAKPFDWKALTNHGAGPEQELAFGGHGYTRQGGEGGWSKSRLDDRTVVIGNEPAVLRYLAQRQRPPRGHSWDEAAKRVGPGPVFFATNNTWMVERLQPMADGLGSATMAMVAPLWSEAFAHALSLDAKDGITFDAVSVSGNEAAAGRVADTVRALVTLGRNSLRSVKVQADGGGPSVAGDQS